MRCTDPKEKTVLPTLLPWNDQWQDLIRLVVHALDMGDADTIRDAIVLAFHQKALELAEDYQEEPTCDVERYICQKHYVPRDCPVTSSVFAKRRDIRRLWRQGLSIQEIATKVSLTPQDVETLLRWFNPSFITKGLRR